MCRLWRLVLRRRSPGTRVGERSTSLGAHLHTSRGAASCNPGDLDAGRHDVQRLKDEVWARGARLSASQREEHRLQAVVGERDGELREARRRERILQEELLEARREVEHLRATRDKQRSREDILQWQLGAARAEAQELRDEVARLEGEASGLPGGRH